MNGQKNQDLRAQLERLPGQIRRYYNAYFSQLRSELARPDLFFDAVPDFLKGYKRVISVGGKDGLVVVHFPIELEITVSETDTGDVLIRFPSVPDATEDTFEFVAFRRSPVSGLVSLVSGREEEVGVDDLTSEVQWGAGVAGAFNQPQLKVDTETGQLTWQAQWTRLVFADFNYLHLWEDTEEARREARKDLQPYRRGLERKELDEVAAPEDIKEAGVNAGDRGVVLEVFEHPRPALLVEYADLLGQTKALVTYSEDLETILDVLVDQDFRANRVQVSNWDETVREQTFDFSPRSPVTEGRLVPA